MTFTQACERCAAYTRDNECTAHVTAKVVIRNGVPVIDEDGFAFSDWVDGSVIRTYHVGVERD